MRMAASAPMIVEVEGRIVMARIKERALLEMGKLRQRRAEKTAITADGEAVSFCADAVRACQKEVLPFIGEPNVMVQAAATVNLLCANRRPKGMDVRAGGGCQAGSAEGALPV